MESIRSSILKCIYEHADRDSQLINALNQIVAEHGSGVYQIILHVLTHLDLSAEKAESCWKEIISHQDNLSKILGRNLSLRTAICDYFCSIDKSLKNPIIIEIHIFEATANSSKFDSLTGLYSRGFFETSLEREIARAKRYKRPFSVAIIDLDNFKAINDILGHAIGDDALKKLAVCMKSQKRTPDVLARYGGDEFVILMPETRAEDAVTSLERLRAKVHEIKLGENLVGLTTSNE